MMKMGFRIRNKFENALNFINFQKENNFIGEDDVYYSKYLIIKEEILREMEIMNYDKSIQLIYDFLWKTYCDVWIENSKKKSIVLTLEKILNDFEPLFSIFFESEEKRKEKDITDDTNFVE
jgi:valyl-tRNA synthetase